MHKAQYNHKCTIDHRKKVTQLHDTENSCYVHLQMIASYLMTETHPQGIQSNPKYM